MNRSLLLSFFICLMAATSCRQEKKPAVVKEKVISDSTLKLLQIESAVNAAVGDEIKLTGIVSFDENKVVKVFPFSSGQVLHINASLGDYVHKGQQLATIRSADIASNYADLSSAGNDVSIAKRVMENAEQLYKNGISSQKEYLEAKENYQKSLANAGKIRSQIQINGGGRTSPNGIYVVSAPRSGYIVEKLINAGNFIRNDNNSSLFTIGDISDVWVWANVFETDISKVTTGSEAKVTTVAYPDRTFTGKVDNVSQFLDPVTKVMKVRIVLPNPGNVLKPEMFANISISDVENRTLVTIPTSAVISENGKNFVVIYTNQNDVAVQEIKIYKTFNDKTFLLSGVLPDQKIITKNQILVYRKLKDK